MHHKQKLICFYDYIVYIHEFLNIQHTNTQNVATFSISTPPTAARTVSSSQDSPKHPWPSLSLEPEMRRNRIQKSQNIETLGQNLWTLLTVN